MENKNEVFNHERKNKQLKYQGTRSSEESPSVLREENVSASRCVVGKRANTLIPFHRIGF